MDSTGQSRGNNHDTARYIGFLRPTGESNPTARLVADSVTIRVPCLRWGKAPPVGEQLRALGCPFPSLTTRLRHQVAPVQAERPTRLP